jgi:hypothetical protein
MPALQRWKYEIDRQDQKSAFSTTLSNYLSSTVITYWAFKDGKIGRQKLSPTNPDPLPYRCGDAPLLTITMGRPLLSYLVLAPKPGQGGNGFPGP